MINNIPEIGLDVSSFAKIYPDIVGNKIDDNFQYNTDEIIFNLKGKWAYNFSEGKLEWIMFNSYCNNIDKKNFALYLTDTERVVSLLQGKYGMPVELNYNEKKYIDPFVKRHWGYDVVSAIWRTGKMDFKVSFKFAGARGEYNFLMKMEFHEVGYKYF